MGRMTHVLTALAWPYANGPRHIGHVAGFGVPADVFARYMRMRGHDVLMVSGTDEHGTPILVQADAEGLTAAEAAAKYNRIIVEDLDALGLSYDLFTRTTTGNHYKTVQELFTTLYGTGTSCRRRRSARSARRRVARCRTGTSRARARIAGSTRRAATSATTAGASSTRST